MVFSPTAQKESEQSTCQMISYTLLLKKGTVSHFRPLTRLFCEVKTIVVS